jgi:hypothetical protein
MRGAIFYETPNCIDSFAIVDAGADAAHGTRSCAEYSKSGPEYSGSAAGAFTGPKYARLSEFSVAGSERHGAAKCTNRPSAAAEYSCASDCSGAAATHPDAASKVIARLLRFPWL